MSPVDGGKLLGMRTAVLPLLLAVLAVGCSDATDDAAPSTSAAASTSRSTTTSAAPASTTTTTTSTTTIPPAVAFVDDLVAGLSARELAQQLVVFGDAGRIEAELVEETGTLCFGGLFVTDLSENWRPVDSVDAAASAMAALRSSFSACSIPPFVATDAEVGANVLRVPVDPLPDAQTLEANHRADPGTTSEGLAPAASVFAASLRAVGVDVNFGVVADVDAADGFYMDTAGRSFGSDPNTVGEITSALIEGHCAAGVAPALKHFPNQGSTEADPHLDDSFSINDAAAWRTVGAIPYESTNAPMVMVGHIRYPSIDGGTPASLSTTIVSGWLRSELGYEGVVITDDLLVMRGAGRELSPAQRAIDALVAGADLALFVDAERGVATIDAIEERILTDEAFAAKARVSAARTVRLKGALGLLPGAEPDWFSLCASR
ncbi:MAG: glycoside hydrolase family 3 N-terminal domain-containing protein [Actinomycetota bacterium]